MSFLIIYYHFCYPMAYNFTVKDRIRQFAETTHLEDKYFEQRIGMYNGALRKPNAPTSGMLEKLKAAYPRLDMNWLITGNGSMLLPSADSSVRAFRDYDKFTSIDEVKPAEVAEAVMPYDVKGSEMVSIPASLLLSLQQQLENKDAQLAAKDKQIETLISKIK